MEAGIRVGYGGGDGESGSASAGIFLRLDLPGPVNLELSGDYWTEDTEGGAVEAANLPLQATALLYPLPALVLKPYVAGGAGMYFVELSSSGRARGGLERDYHLLSAHAGGGLELPLAGIGGVAAEFRYTFAEDTGADVFGSGYSPGGWRLFAAFFVSF